MKKRLLLVITAFLFLSGYAQDSVYYSILWKPTYTYQKAGVKQEGIFHYQYKDGVIQDSFLLNANLYDSLGQLTRMDVYYGSRLRTRYQHFYTRNRLDSTIQEEYWINVKTVHRYSYEANGNLALKETFNGAEKILQERYTYNSSHQPLQTFKKLGGGREVLIYEFTYRPDRLVQQIDYWFEGAESADNFSYLYGYSNGTRRTTRYFKRQSKEKRLIDCIRTYNENGQLVEKINAPLPAREWLPPSLHPRPEESIETYSYYPNGLLAEVRTKVNDQLTSVRKHVYFY